MAQTQQQTDFETIFSTSKERNLVLFNDDFNTFDYVIEMLVSVCEHTSEQAEQCAITVHFKGKCVVKSGTETQLIPKLNALINGGLTAEIQ